MFSLLSLYFQLTLMYRLFEDNEIPRDNITETSQISAKNTLTDWERHIICALLLFYYLIIYSYYLIII